MKNINKWVVGAIASMCAAGAVAAEPSDGDFAGWGFLNSGKIPIQFDVGGNLADFADDSIVTPDGSMFIAATVASASGTKFGVAKLTPAGAPQNLFSADGKSTSFESGVVASAIAFTGTHILVAGTKTVSASDKDFIVCRFNATNGGNENFPAPTNNDCVSPVFLPGTSDFASDIVIQPDGKFIVAGTVDAGGTSSRAGFARFLADGQPDLSFGSIQGSNMRLVRNEQIYARHKIHAVALAANGKIVGVGETVGIGDTQVRSLLIRLNSNGTQESLGPEKEFATIHSPLNNGGSVYKDLVLIDDPASSDDEIVAVGHAEVGGGKLAGLIAKIRSNGQSIPVNSFGTNGARLVTLASGSLNYTAIAAQPGGGLIALGMRPGVGDDLINIDVSRFTYRGDFDTAFGNAGVVVFDGGTVGEFDLPGGVAVHRDGVYFSGSTAMANENYDIVAVKLELDRIFYNGVEED